MAFLPLSAAAQSSTFSVRGLGVPVQGISTASRGMAGANGLLDPQSSLDPASLAGADTLTATLSAFEDFRSSSGPAGTASARVVRFPHMMVSTAIGRSRFVVGFSVSSMLARDFGLATTDTVSPYGTPVVLADTFVSRGGVSELQGALAWRSAGPWSLGVGVHILTGTNRLESHASFNDSLYASTLEKAELSYAGYGASLGVRGDFGALTLTALAGLDHGLRVDLDSTRLGTIPMPTTLGGGLRWRSSRLELAGQAIWRNWSRATGQIGLVGGYGADNTVDLSAGLQYVRNVRRPTHFPLRLGARWTSLPFQILPGYQPHELDLSLGTGTRFAGERGGLDFALEHVNRYGAGYTERAWRAALGITVRP